MVQVSAGYKGTSALDSDFFAVHKNQELNEGKSAQLCTNHFLFLQ